MSIKYIDKNIMRYCYTIPIGKVNLPLIDLLINIFKIWKIKRCVIENGRYKATK